MCTVITRQRKDSEPIVPVCRVVSFSFHTPHDMWTCCIVCYILKSTNEMVSFNTRPLIFDPKCPGAEGHRRSHGWCCILRFRWDEIPVAVLAVAVVVDPLVVRHHTIDRDIPLAYRLEKYLHPSSPWTHTMHLRRRFGDPSEVVNSHRIPLARLRHRGSFPYSRIQKSRRTHIRIHQPWHPGPCLPDPREPADPCHPRTFPESQHRPCLRTRPGHRDRPRFRCRRPDRSEHRRNRRERRRRVSSLRFSSWLPGARCIPASPSCIVPCPRTPVPNISGACRDQCSSSAVL
mmetsp:Transcript_24027/g.56675  ORF Transcript_24027/g.56675 Transcript_24027/m.56675 type:complete len:289 (-) Transcript_24027:399-1265(-)